MTPLFKKLNFKNQLHIVVLNAPESFEGELNEMAADAAIARHVEGVQEIEFVLIFVTKQAEIDESIQEVYPKWKGDAILWFCYPKGTSKKYKCDFNRDTGWATLGKYNLEPVRQVAIDEDWSALRFRNVEYMKNFTRSSAISDEGKKRISNQEI